MARPSKGSPEAAVEERIEAAFWEILEARHLSQVSVSALVRKAGINRSTFYYHYEDIDDLARRAVSRNLPTELPRIALLLFSGELDHPKIDEDALVGLAKICLLIGHDGSRRIASIVEDALVDMWSEEFEISHDTPNSDVMRALKFMAGGVTSTLARHGHPMDLAEIRECMRVMNEAYTAPTLAYLSKRWEPSSTRKPHLPGHTD